MMLSRSALATLFVAADAALKDGPFAHASIQARAAFTVGFANGLAGWDRRTRLDSSEEIAAFDEGLRAGTAARETPSQVEV